MLARPALEGFKVRMMDACFAQFAVYLFIPVGFMYYCNHPSYTDRLRAVKAGIIKGRDMLPMPENIDELKALLGRLDDKKADHSGGNKGNRMSLTADSSLKSANEAVCIRLIEGDKVLHEFHPAFTYTFFGSDEAIPSGNKRCIIDMDACSLKTRVSEAGSEENTFDIKGPIAKLLDLSDDPIDLCGLKLASFSHNHDAFEVYKFAIDQLPLWHSRAKIMSLFLIEGASLIDEADAKWIVYPIYQVIADDADKRARVWCGYCTAYPFLLFPDRIRLRLSQFIILPPWQGKGVGTQLYKTIVGDALQSKDVGEITVEDATPQFDAMRLKGDYELFKSVESREQSKLCKDQWDKLAQLKSYAGQRDSDDFRTSYKRRLLKRRAEELPGDAVERKRLLQEWYVEDRTVFDRILA